MPTHTKKPKNMPFRIPIAVLGHSLGLFVAFAFVLCVGFGLIFPGATMYQTWLPLLPGVSWISWPSFGLGLVETFGYGWFVALVAGSAFNYIPARGTR